MNIYTMDISTHQNMNEFHKYNIEQRNTILFIYIKRKSMERKVRGEWMIKKIVGLVAGEGAWQGGRRGLDTGNVTS